MSMILYTIKGNSLPLVISLVFNDNRTNFSVKFLSDLNFISYIYISYINKLNLNLQTRVVENAIHTTFFDHIITF
jgi:hypothetical protein